MIASALLAYASNTNRGSSIRFHRLPRPREARRLGVGLLLALTVAALLVFRFQGVVDWSFPPPVPDKIHAANGDTSSESQDDGDHQDPGPALVSDDATTLHTRSGWSSNIHAPMASDWLPDPDSPPPRAGLPM